MKPFLVGITGTIGSGKSRLLTQLQALDIPVIKADIVAKQVLYTDEHKHKLCSILGETIFDNLGTYNLKEVRRILFSNNDTMGHLKAFGNPLIWKRIQEMIRASGQLIAVVENAVLFEDGWGEYFNLTVCLSCHEAEAIKRVMTSRGLDENTVRSIMKSQMPIEQKIALSDIHIDTTHFARKDTTAAFRALCDELNKKY